MADIHLKCEACGREMKVSEYVSSNSVPCAGCGESIPVRPESKTEVLKLKHRPSKTELAAEEKPVISPFQQMVEAEEHTNSASPTLSDIHKKSVSGREKLKAKRGVFALIASWVLFLVLGGALYWWRWHYVAGLAAAVQQEMILYGLIGIGVAYLLCVIIALKDNMFDGFLSIILPGYAYYYIFMVSSSIFMRAVVGAVFIGVGYDLLMFLQYHATRIYEVVSAWIGSGG